MVNRPGDRDMARILIVDDEACVRDFVADAMARAGHVTQCAADARSALRCVHEWGPALVLLDLDLGGPPSGLDLCRAIRRHPKGKDIFVVILTGQPSDDLQAGLYDAGADDYVMKHNYSFEAFRSRVDALLRRQRRSDRFEYGRFEIHPGRMELRLDGEPVDLTASEFMILCRLAAAKGEILPREDLLDRGSLRPSRAVDMHVAAIRRKLGEDGALLESVYGVGYRLRGERPACPPERALGRAMAQGAERG
jgi:DNA-binding response OmpR family regulator